MTLTRLFERSIDNAGDRHVVEVLRDGTERTRTFADLGLRAVATLAFLQREGLGPGRRLLVQVGSAHRQLEVFWACILGGIVPALLPKVVARGRDGAATRRLATAARALGSAALLVDRDAACSDRGGGATLPVERWIADDPDAACGDARLHRARSEDVAYVQFSSGTTGDPRGVRLTHRNVVSNVEDIILAARLRAGDSFVSWMPYFHDMGLVGFHLVPFAFGGDHVKMDAAHFAASPLAWLRLLDRRRATVTSCPDFGLHHVVETVSPADVAGLDLSCVRSLLNGAEPISASVMRRFLALVEPAGFRSSAMHPVYGMADATLAVTFSPPEAEPAVRRVDAGRLAAEWVAAPPREGAPVLEYLDVGYPLRSVELRIADPHGRPLPDGHLGEVQIRGAAVAAGYEGAAGAATDAGGWHATGDVGFLRDGRLSVAGRVRDVLRGGGGRFLATDVERQLTERFSLRPGGVAVCAARDAEGGESVVVFVAARRRPDLWPWVRELHRAAEEILQRRVSCVLPVPALPRTTSGKLQRFRLADEFASGVHDDARAAFVAQAQGA